jgi:hypothetical protein
MLQHLSDVRLEGTARSGFWYSAADIKSVGCPPMVQPQISKKSIVTCARDSKENWGQVMTLFMSRGWR